MWKKIVIAVIVIAVIGAVGLFIADRTIFAPSQVTTGVPAAPTLAAPSSSSGAPAPSGSNSASAKVYRIDPNQSEVHYEVAETFADGNRLNLAIGRTKGIAGDILIDADKPGSSQIGDIVINVSQFTSDESRRDNFIRRTGLESSKYPKATFKTKSIEGLPAQVNPGDAVTFTISGDLTVKETTKPVTWQVKAQLGQNGLSGEATTQIKMSDFGVGPLKLPILATEDNVKLVFDFVAAPAQG